MDSKILHNMKDIPFNDRESFNNAILLLSMVKSEYYYIVGFSRPKNQIEIGFDFDDKTYGRLSETVTMDFSGNLNSIVLSIAVEKIFMYHIRRVSPLSLLLAALLSANCFRQNFRDRRKACP